MTTQAQEGADKKSEASLEDHALPSTQQDEAAEDAQLWEELDALDRGEEPSGSAQEQEDERSDDDDDDPSEPDSSAKDGEVDDWDYGDEPDPASAKDDKQGKTGKEGDGNAAPHSETGKKGLPSGDQQQQAPGNQDDAIWANATPEQRAAIEAVRADKARLEHQYRSDRGRISALQRQNYELQQRLAKPSQDPKDKPAAGKAADPKGAPPGQGSEEGADDFVNSEAFRKFAEEYPEIAEPLKSGFEHMQAKTARFEKELAAIGSERREQASTEQEALLAEQHPDYLELTAEREFAEWLPLQSRMVQEAFQRNFESIVDARESADVIRMYREDRARRLERQQQQQGGGSAQTNKQAPAGKPPAGNGNRQAMGPRRKAQLEGASSAKSRTPSRMTSGIPEDGDEKQLWDAWEAEERRQARN